jgi:hypothetical protein
MDELKKEILDRFWSIYDTEGTVQALNWLESLKYYEEYCSESYDIMSIIKKTQDMSI